MTDLESIPFDLLNGERACLGDYAGRVRLIVNTASRCGFTPQYAGLEALYQLWEGQGLTVIGFPCNQFGRQEPGDAEAIGQFCLENYGVSFPMAAKIAVNGANAHPLFTALKAAAPGVAGSLAIKWNFTKFLLDRQGRVLRRYAPITPPAALTETLRALL